jgi:hypothetical protein
MRTVAVGGVAALVAVLVAGCHPSPTPSSTPPSSASSPVGPPGSVVPLDLVSAPCLQPDGSMRVFGTCAVHVADPKQPSVLVLQSDRAFSVYVGGESKLVAPKGDGMARVGIPVTGPADVTVRCVGAAVCSVSIGDAMPDLSG